MVTAGHASADHRWIRAEELAGDASSRAYRRLWDRAGRSVVEVCYPPSNRAQMARDLEVLAWCRRRGLPVAGVLAARLEEGLALLEDFGPADAGDTLAAADPGQRPSLAVRLIGPLALLAAIDPAELPGWNPPLDRHRLRWELAGFELWFLGHGCGHPPGVDVSAWLDHLAEEVAGHPLRVCHRDYHVNNLYLAGRPEAAMIDIQDILVGPDTYDVASLLGERALPELLSPAQVAGCLEGWAGRTRAAPGWLERHRQVRLQRGLKVLGTFARLVASGRPQYGSWMTPLAAALADDCTGAGAPPSLPTHLLNWGTAGGPHVG